MLGSVIQGLCQLFFLGADHVLDVATGGGHFVILFAPAGDRLKQATVGKRLAVGDDHFGERVFSGRKGDDVPAVDEPDIGLIGAADDLLRPENLKQLRVERALIQQEGKTSRPALFSAIAHASVLFPGDKTPRVGRRRKRETLSRHQYGG